MGDAGPYRTFTYKTVGSLELQADVYCRGEGEARPAILWLHGGALIMNARNSLTSPALFGRLMDAGYAVISADYRLAPETQLADIVGDVEDAYGWILAEGPELFGIDPARVAIMGMSAGGYLTLTAGFRVRPAPKALVSFYGYGDVTGAWYTEPSEFYRAKYPIVSHDAGYAAVQGPAVAGAPTPEAMQGRPNFYLYCRQNGLWPHLVAGRDPMRDAAWFAGYEALRNVTPSFPPTILLHGEKDTDVPHAQSVLMAEALDRNGVPHEFVSHPDWGHVFDHVADDPTVAPALDRVMAFLAKRFVTPSG